MLPEEKLKYSETRKGTGSTELRHKTQLGRD